MRAAIGSQCKLMNGGLTCVLFGSLKINLAAAFGLIVEVNGADWKTCQESIAIVWTEQELEQGVVLHVPKERA